MTRCDLIQILAAGLAVSCVVPSTEPPIESLDPPAMAGSFAPRLSTIEGGALLTWLERLGDERHRLRFARLDGEIWSAATTLASGDDFFANWADCPAVVQGQDGSLIAHRLHRIGAGTYEYGIEIFHRAATDTAWEARGELQDSAQPAEYGFVSYVPAADGVRAFWLDGRAMAAASASSGLGDMQLRTAAIRQGVVEPSLVLDDRVCECCQTDAVLTSEGLAVVYRDRSPEEIRDISIVLGRDGTWSEPRPVHVDGWQIPGCPVNGPAIAAADRRVAVAWFTAADGRPRVLLAISEDAGASFGEPQQVDADAPLGRVDVALGGDGTAVWVSWIGTAGPVPRVLLRRVHVEEGPGEILALAETTKERAAGFPHLVRSGDRLLAAWVEEGGGGGRIRVAAVPLR